MVSFTHFINSLHFEAEWALLTGSVLLLLIVMVLYFRRVIGLLKGPKPVYKNTDQIRKWVEESEVLYERLLKALEEKREIANRLVAQLDGRIETLRSMMAEVERGRIPIVEEVQDQGEEAEVMKLAEAGRDVSDIAKQTGLSIGEIQLIMNLKRYQDSSLFKIA